jgi:predicted DNA-binding protein (MmcQ/YjbR family)
LGRDIHQTVREVCLWLPEAEERLSHGSPNFKVRGKTFASYVVNHHGDGRVALWLNAPAGSQEHHVRTDSRHFFVPPYVGPRGWLGVLLDQGLAWKRIATLVREAYEKVAPSALQHTIGKTPLIEPPSRKLSIGQIDPMQSPRGKALLKTMRQICLPLPESSETLQFGYPVWQAGKKTFAWARCADHGLSACFWVGVDQQGLLTADARYRVPAYMGHNGWIALDVTERCHPEEVRALALQSYRHFALQRMLRRLEVQ